MDRYAVVGNPVEHSQSPFIHARFAEACGQVLRYERILSGLSAFAAKVHEFAQDGGSGCNVTLPFKAEAFGLAKRSSARARQAAVVNTLRFDAEGWFGDNTDGIGLVRDIGNAQVEIAAARVLVVGAGGAAAGILGALIDERPASLSVVNRSASKAISLVDAHSSFARQNRVMLTVRPIEDPGTGYDIVINATASSLSGAPVPVTPHVLKPGSLALDLMYGPAADPFLEWAKAHGARARDGLGMLVEQAAEAFHVWRGLRPETASVLAALRQRLTQHSS